MTVIVVDPGRNVDGVPNLQRLWRDVTEQESGDAEARVADLSFTQRYALLITARLRNSKLLML